MRRNRRSLTRDLTLGSLGLGVGSIAVSSVRENPAFLANISKAMPFIGNIDGASMILKSTKLLNPTISKKRKKNGSF